MPSIDYRFDQMMNPLLAALKDLGGSGTNEEIVDKVVDILAIPQDQQEVLHNPNKGSMTEIEYRLMWTKTYLKYYELLENSERGVWSLTKKGYETQNLQEREVVRFVRELMKKEKSEEPDLNENGNTKQLTWQDKLLEVVSSMTPQGFERLSQRILRESGFVQVKVTGRSGDGGIDGLGVLRLSGLISFKVVFQCKKWKGSVSSKEVRDFRGGMMGRADKGFIITTGHFTADAKAEASRDGTLSVDLIDGEELAEILKNLKLGVETKKVVQEEVTIDPSWFIQFDHR